MKRIQPLIILLPFFALVLISPIVAAQEAVTSLDSLHIAFWPDFDDPSVLVLMDGRLPEAAPSPSLVTLPIPVGARVNAVARSDPEFGLASIEHEIGEQSVTFSVSPGETFRVEFYVPYREDGQWRSFTYEWLADNLDVGEITAEVQQPSFATQMTTDPQALRSRTSTNDGLIYHTLPVQSAPAGTPYQVSFRYDQGDVQNAGDGSPAIDNILLLIIGGVGLLIAAVVVTWFLATRNSTTKRPKGSKRPRKPQKARPVETEKSAAQFCHNCGEPGGSGDKFCRKCGTLLKE